MLLVAIYFIILSSVVKAVILAMAATVLAIPLFTLLISKLPHIATLSDFIYYPVLATKACSALMTVKQSKKYQTYQLLPSLLGFVAAI